MERPDDIETLDTRVTIAGGNTGAQMLVSTQYIEAVMAHIDAYNAFYATIGVTSGTPLATGVIRVADDGVKATTTTDTPRAYNGTTRPVFMEDSGYV